MAEQNSTKHKNGTSAVVAAAPHLLVPINVQALVSVNSYMGSQDNWALEPMNYSNLSTFVSPEPQPLTHSQLLLSGGVPWTGVMLHWALPDALTHGTQQAASPAAAIDSKGDVTFPNVPNRWMVIRTSMDPNHPNDPNSRITRVWVVQSGYLDLAANVPAGNSFQYDFAQGQEMYLGRSWLLSSAPPQGSATATEIQLQAIGPGDATFAAYIANVNNIFSFRDDLMSDFPQPNLNVPAAWAGHSSPPPNQGLPLTYLVAGWYSDPAQDPLHNAAKPADWQKIMKTMMWSVDQPGLYPTQTLCHGAVYGVNWLGHDGAVQSGIPTQTKLPLVAVGNTTAEALAAMARYQLNQPAEGAEPKAEGAEPAVDGEAVAQILEAFQYNLLPLYDRPGGEAQIDEQKHQARFGSVQGGTLWDVTRPTPDDSFALAAQPSTDTGPPQLTPAQSALLQQVNALQQELDKLSRQLEAMQWDLYSLWWKLLYLLAEGSTQYFIRMARQSYLNLKAEVRKQQAAVLAVRNGTTGRSGLEQVKQALIQSLGTKLQLVKKDAGRFWHPVDPVVLICGAKGSFKHGADHLYTDDGTLFCRVTGQTVNSMTVAGGKSSAVLTGDNLLPSSSTNPFNADPQTAALLNPPLADVLALFKETLLLDTTNAMMLTQAAVRQFKPPDNAIAPQSLAPSIVAQQNSVWNFTLHDALNQQTAADHAGFTGVIPSRNCIEYWSPPWSPLYLDWSVRWLPSWPDTGHLLDNWKFGPTSDDPQQLDYNWTSATPPDPTVNGLTFQGRTLLTSKAADSFAARLEQFMEHVNPSVSDPASTLADDGAPASDDPASSPQDIGEALGEVTQLIGNWDLLSQSLSGLHQQLIMRNPEQHIPVTKETLTGLLNSGQLQPGETVADLLNLLGNADTAMPLPQVPLLHRKPPPYTPAPPPAYNPLRAGHFVITNLWIIDDFGQVYSVFSATQSQPYFRPIISQSLQTLSAGQTPSVVPGVVQLPPRLSQPARLSFTLLSASEQKVETTSDPLTNPVCGWALPNHLDNGLTIYAADGTALGEMLLAGGEQNRRVLWEPAPGSPAPVGAPPDIANERLRKFVTGLLGRTDSVAAFMDFMGVIDATLWTIDPLGGRANQSLSVLIGRPLALVRAKLKLELQGHPVYDESWANMGQQVKCWPYPPDTNKTAPPDFTTTVFDVRLGSLDLRDDGLLGYFLNGNYQQFISVHQPPSSNSSSEAYIVQQDFQLRFNSDDAAERGESVADVTLLVDPRGSVHASTGILPVKSVVVPGEYVEQPLARMEVTFRIGPVLTDEDKIRMPLPAISRSDWTWIRQTGVTVWQSESDIGQTSPTARLSDTPMSVREGWLKLSSLTDNDQT